MSAVKGITFVVTRVQLYSLVSIDDLAQTFECQLYVILLVPGSANDPDLLADRFCPNGEAPFPTDPKTGQPTFRPGILWYLSRLEFVNQIHVERVETAVMARNDDLVCALRWKGVFTEPLELEQFPFDVQPLTMQLVANNRTDGPVPIYLEVDPECQKSIDPRNSFAMYQSWRLYNDVLGVVSGMYDDGDNRRFPSLEMSCLVERKAGFCVVNVALPTLLISLFSVVPFVVPKAGNESARVATSMFLVFTVMAFKDSVRSIVPAVSYLTLIDRYVLGVMVLVFISLGLAAAGSRIASEDESNVAHWDRDDLQAIGILLGIWLILHVYFAFQVYRAMRAKNVVINEIRDKQALARQRIKRSVSQAPTRSRRSRASESTCTDSTRSRWSRTSDTTDSIRTPPTIV